MADSLGRLIVSLAIIIGFFGYMYLVVKLPIQPEMKTAVELITGGLIGLLTTVVNYYVGSSAGSKSKDKTIGDSIQKPTEPPNGVPPKGPNQ